MRFSDSIAGWQGREYVKIRLQSFEKGPPFNLLGKNEYPVN
jgi:hypothetical protein